MRSRFWYEIQKERDHLERCWHRWEDNIKIYSKEIGWKDTDCTHLVHDMTQWQAVENKPSNYLPDTTRSSIEEEEMGGARGTTGKNETCVRGFGTRYPEGKRPFGKTLAQMGG